MGDIKEFYSNCTDTDELVDAVKMFHDLNVVGAVLEILLFAMYVFMFSGLCMKKMKTQENGDDCSMCIVCCWTIPYILLCVTNIILSIICLGINKRWVGNMEYCGMKINVNTQFAIIEYGWADSRNSMTIAFWV